MASKKKSGLDYLKERYAKLENENYELFKAHIKLVKKNALMYDHMGWFRRWLWDRKYNDKK